MGPVRTSSTPAPDVTFTVNVMDDDAGLRVSPQAVTVTEGNTTTGVPYTVALNAAPSGPVTATSAADDDDGVDAQVTLTHAAAAGSGNPFTFTARAADNVTVTIDDETPGVTLSPTNLTLQEDPSAGGGTDQHVRTYTALLAGQNIGVGVTSSDGGR